jgi:hypothetical protein
LEVFTANGVHFLERLSAPDVGDFPQLIARLDEQTNTEEKQLSQILSAEQIAAYREQTDRRREALNSLAPPSGARR